MALRRAETIGDLARRFGGDADPNATEQRVERIVAPPDATNGADLVVVTAARFVRIACERPGIFLCTTELAARLPADRRWIHPHAEWAMAELLAEAEPERDPPAISAAAQVARGAEIAEDVRIAPGAVISAGARVGPGSSIGENAVIYPNVRVGARVVVGPLAVLGRPGFGFVSGPDGKIRRVPQLGGVVVEDDVEIGALVTVDAGTLRPTRIGAGAKLDAHVHVGHNVEIGSRSLVAAQSGFAGSVTLGSGVLVGGQAGVKDHVTIGARTKIAAKSGVIGDVPEGSVVAGFPAVSRARWLRAMAKLFELADADRRIRPKSRPR